MRLKQLLIGTAAAGLLASPAMAANIGIIDPSVDPAFVMTSVHHRDNDGEDRLREVTQRFASDYDAALSQYGLESLSIEVRVFTENPFDTFGTVLFTFKNNPTQATIDAINDEWNGRRHRNHNHWSEIEQIYFDDGPSNFLRRGQIYSSSSGVDFQNLNLVPFDGILAPPFNSHWRDDFAEDSGGFFGLFDVGNGVRWGEEVSIAFDFDEAWSPLGSLAEAIDAVRVGIHLDYRHGDDLFELAPLANGNENRQVYWADMPLPPGTNAEPVPEPGTLALLSTGLVGLVCWGRRRRP